MVQLSIYYTFTHGRYGEAWTTPGSYLEAFGMILLLVGTAIYNGSIKLPGDEPQPEPQPQPRPQP